MICQDTKGEFPAFHVPDDAIHIAQQVQQFTGVIQNNRVAGNGSIVITLKVVGGKLRRFFDLSFPDFTEKTTQGQKRTKRT